jgi:hypothetical protein
MQFNTDIIKNNITQDKIVKLIFTCGNFNNPTFFLSYFLFQLL